MPLSSANSTLLNEDELNLIQRHPSTTTYLHSSGSATPVFGQSFDTASTLSRTPRATTPITYLNSEKIESMGNLSSTNGGIDVDHYRNNDTNDTIMNDRSFNISHNHPIYRF